jgi:hypothetical protein
LETLLCRRIRYIVNRMNRRLFLFPWLPFNDEHTLFTYAWNKKTLFLYILSTMWLDVNLSM